MKRVSRYSLVFLSCALLTCESGSPTPPEETGQSVTVQVATSGDDIDADGYTVRLGNRSATVAATGTATFEDVSAGTYEVRLEGVASNCLVQGEIAQNVTVTSSSGAQTSFAVTCTVDFGDGVQTVACLGLAPAVSSAMPLDHVAMGQVPAGFSPPLAARVLSPDGTSLGYTFLEVDEQGNAEMVTPLHPSGALEGGQVLIRVTDGNSACEPFEFTIEPMPASPGELAGIANGLQDVLTGQAAILGTTTAHLIATPIDQLEEPFIPLAIMQYVLDHPDNDESLRRIADGTAPVDYPLDLIEALLSRTGFLDALENQIPAAAPVGADWALGVVPSAGNCIPPVVADDTEFLSDCMNTAAEMQAFFSGFAENVQAGMSEAAGLVAAGQLTEGAINLIIRGLWLGIQAELESFALLPRIIDAVAVEADPADFEEDNPGTGMWTAQATARSLGWDVALDFVHNILNAAGSFDALEQAGAGDTDVASELQSLLTGPVGDFLFKDGVPLEDANIPSRGFGPVPITGEQWSEPDYNGTSVEKVDHNTYKPVEAGVTTLLVFPAYVHQGNYQFGGGAPLGPGTVVGTAPITVKEIEIKIDPAETSVEPGEEVTFKITVENSLFPHEITAGSVATLQGTLGELTFTGENTADLPYTAPNNPDADQPDRIKVTHIATTGARASGQPERAGRATVNFGSIRISPRPFCVDTSDEVQFTAVVPGQEDQTVTWTATEGTIDEETGEYIAPPDRPAGGYVTVTATSNANPELVDQVTFAIGCTCNYGVTVAGNTVLAQPGDRLVFNTSGGRLYNVSITRPGASIRLLPPNAVDMGLWPNAPGNWLMHVQGDIGLTDENDILYATSDEFLATLNLTELIPFQSVKGSISDAFVGVVSSENPRLETLDWWFAITYPPGGFECIVGEDAGG